MNFPKAVDLLYVPAGVDIEAGNEAVQTGASALLGRVDFRLESLLAEPKRREDGKRHENGEHKDLRHHERRLRLRRS